MSQPGIVVEMATILKSKPSLSHPDFYFFDGG